MLNRTGGAIATVLTALAALVLAASGLRRRVLAENLRRTRVGPSPCGWGHFRFRYRLAGRLLRDLAALAAGPRAPRFPVAPRSVAALETLRAGPSLLLTAHFGNWELQAAAWRRHGVDLLGAARPLKSRAGGLLLDAVRARHGIRVVSRSVPRAALRHLAGGGCFGFLWDQHAPDSLVTGRFFGLPVRLDPLPAFLLQRDPMPVYFGVLLPDRTLRLLRLAAAEDTARPDAVPRLARRYHRVLELLARRHPDRWYGALHARFKGAVDYGGHRQ